MIELLDAAAIRDRYIACVGLPAVIKLERDGLLPTVQEEQNGPPVMEETDTERIMRWPIQTRLCTRWEQT